MAPQIILTTGANQGLGFAIIQVIAQRLPSALHVLACRDVASGNDAVQKLRDQGINSEIDVVQLDVTNDDLIEKAVDHVNSKYHRLDGKDTPSSSTLFPSPRPHFTDSYSPHQQRRYPSAHGK